MLCLSVRGDNPRALAGGLSPVQVGKQWHNYFSVDPANYEIFMSKLVILLGWYSII